MLRNVIEIENCAVKLAREAKNNAAILLLDVGAAFPSLNREFLWIALKEIPEMVVNY